MGGVSPRISGKLTPDEGGLTRAAAHDSLCELATHPAHEDVRLRGRDVQARSPEQLAGDLAEDLVAPPLARITS